MIYNVLYLIWNLNMIIAHAWLPHVHPGRDHSEPRCWRALVLMKMMGFWIFKSIAIFLGVSKSFLLSMGNIKLDLRYIMIFPL